jgi:hypothetical protein
VDNITHIGLDVHKETIAVATLRPGAVISEPLGHEHATGSMTLDTYSHAVPTLSKEAASVIAVVVPQAQPLQERHEGPHRTVVRVGTG